MNVLSIATFSSIVLATTSAQAAFLDRPIAPERSSFPAQGELLVAQSNRCISSYYRVATRDGDPLNLRSSPSMNARVIGKLTPGTEVVLNITDRSGQWAEITAPRGIKGWVATRFLTQVPMGGSMDSMRVKTLDGDALNLRSQPGLGARVIGRLPNGTSVSLVRFVGQWAEVVSPSGMRGYVATQYLVCS